MTACPQCDTPFVPRLCGHGRTKTYCSRTCKTRAANLARTPEQLEANRSDNRTRVRAKAERTAFGREMLRAGTAGLRAAQQLEKQIDRSLAMQARDRRPYCDRLKEFIANYKTSRGCAVCGVASPPYILDLHHIDPTTKSFDPSRAKSFPKAVSEFAKCVVLCAIHHRMVEAGDLPCPKES